MVVTLFPGDLQQLRPTVERAELVPVLTSAMKDKKEFQGLTFELGGSGGRGSNLEPLESHSRQPLF